MSGVPIKWVEATLDEITIRMSNGANVTQYEENVGFPISRIETIWNGYIDKVRVKYIKENYPDFIEKYRLEHNDILFSHINSDNHLGKTALVKGEFECLIHGINLLLIRLSEGVDPKFIEYQFKYKKFLGEFVAVAQRAVNQSSINQQKLKSFKFLIPPLNEQKRIVEKIEELFSELDKGIESLKTAREQLKIYRRSVLKHAFEGKFTEGWRRRYHDQIQDETTLLEFVKSAREQKVKLQGKKTLKNPRPMSDESFTWLSQLPKGWIWERLGWSTTGVEYGTSAKSSKLGRTPVLRMGNIQNQRFDWDDLVFTSDDEETKKYLLRNGDVLFNRTNSPELVGKTAIYRGEQPAIFAGYLIRLNQIENCINPQYLNLYLNSHTAKQFGNKVKTDGVNQSNINGEKLVNYPFPFCSFEEQAEVVEVLEEKMSEIDNMELEVNTQLKKSEVLRQSILKTAFSGKLVPQDPNDEPANVLLERIKADEAKSGRAEAKKRKSK